MVGSRFAGSVSRSDGSEAEVNAVRTIHVGHVDLRTVRDGTETTCTCTCTTCRGEARAARLYSRVDVLVGLDLVDCM